VLGGECAVESAQIELGKVEEGLGREEEGAWDRERSLGDHADAE
jgi:hypothetical protein